MKLEITLLALAMLTCVVAFFVSWWLSWAAFPLIWTALWLQNRRQTALLRKLRRHGA